jgi:nicotinate-nucleotide adenylyltransferase
MKIWIYAGAFDTVHHGHLILARDAREMLGLEKIIFVPAAVSPFKESPAASAKLRLSMLQAAIEGENAFVWDDCELQRPPPSYTIDTVEEIRRREVDSEIYYLIGEDNLPTLAKWHRFTELEKIVRFVVFDRTSTGTKHDYPSVHRRIDISATEIRNRVASGQSIRYFVPRAVAEIIGRQKLYQEQVK